MREGCRDEARDDAALEPREERPDRLPTDIVVEVDIHMFIQAVSDGHT